jgi:hypothetical protein
MDGIKTKTINLSLENARRNGKGKCLSAASRFSSSRAQMSAHHDALFESGAFKAHHSSGESMRLKKLHKTPGRLVIFDQPAGVSALLERSQRQLID